MRKRILATLLSVIMIIGLLPITSLASTTIFEYTIQVVIVDENGKWKSTNALPSKEFNGTTVSGSSYNDDWQWKPDDEGGYTITSSATTAVNAFGRLKYPTALWEYSSDEYEFIGIGKNSYATEPAYTQNVDSSYLFERNSFPFSTRTGYRTYILREKSSQPDAPSDSELKGLLENNAVTVDCINEQVNHGSNNPITYGLLSGSYTKGTITGDSSSGYTYTITVNPEKYVEAYNETNPGHTLDSSSPDTGTITLKWNGSAWKVDSGAPVTFNVTCPTPPTVDEDWENVYLDIQVWEKGAEQYIQHSMIEYLFNSSDKSNFNSEAFRNTVEFASPILNGTTWTMEVTVHGYQANDQKPYTYAVNYLMRATKYNGWVLAEGEDDTKTVTLTYYDKPGTSNDGWYNADGENAVMRFDIEPPTTPSAPAITNFTKDLVTEELTDEELEGLNLDGVTITYPDSNGKVTIPADGSVTLLYKLTVTGDEGANFTITDVGATLVGSDCGAMQDENTKVISGTIPAGGIATIYVIKTFTADDITDGKVTNTANIAAGGGVADDKDTATETTPAEEGKPSTPDEDKWPEILKTGAVKVDCTNATAEHDDATYGLITGGYTSNVTGTAADGWECTITIDTDAYAAHYDTQEGYTEGTHTATTAPAPTITLTWDKTTKAWELKQGTTLPVTVEVKCTTPAPDPTKPDDDEIPGILGATGAVVVECLGVHNAITYNLWVNDQSGTRYRVSDPVEGLDGTWTCDVTILPDVYVAAYNNHYQVEHKLVPADQKDGVTITLTWDKTKNKWTAPEKENGVTYWAKFTVSCAPDQPTDDEIIEALDQNKSILVDCINEASGHTDATFTLWKNSAKPAAERYTVGVPTYDETDGAWTCVVTILPDVYVERYSDDDHTGVAHWLADDTPQEVTLTLNADGKWVSNLESGAYCATFKVLCAPSQGELETLLNGKITVDCTTEGVNHPDATYGLIEGGYTEPENKAVTGSMTDGWKYVITIDASVYADHYSTATGYGVHTASAADPTITLTWNTTENKWTVADGVTIPVTCTPGYTLTYDANGGAFADGKPTNTVSNIQPNTNYSLDGQKPTKSGAVFVGWTTTDTNEAVYGAGQQLPEVVTEVSIPETTTVYAVWGEDTNGDGIADAQQIVITPADITVYTGGDGYDGVVAVEGGITVGSSGIPEPGYYFTLPYALNEKLQGLNGTEGTYVNLANYIRLNDANNPERQWILTLYDGADTSLVTQGYIYRLTEDNSTPAKLVIKDSSGNIVTDDELAISNDALYQDYTMSLDGTAVGDGAIEVEVLINGNWVNVNDQYGEGTVAGLILGEGTLTVRGTHEDSPTLTTDVGSSQSDVVENDEIANEESQTTITAVAPEDTNYTINGSDVSVTNGDIRLLTDGLLPNTVLSGYLDDQGLTGENTKVDYQYLDLVDMNNGNAYVTADKALDIYWKLPADADVSGDFYVVHFNDLDRNYDVANLADLIDANGVDIYSQEKNNLEIVPIEGELYLKFATSSFSPFALVYDTKDEPVVEKVTVTFDSGKHGDFGWYHVTSKDVELTKGDKLAAYQIPYVFEDEGYEFIGWYKQGSGSWHLYSDEDLLEMTFNSDATFIAQYKYVGGPSVDDEYDVVYNANFTDGGVPRRQGYDKGETVTVSENKWFERDGYIFVGWNTEADGTGDSYDPDDTFKMPGRDVYLYAQWQKEKPGPDDTGVSRWLETEDHNAYLTGYPDSTFGADRNMTRAEVAQMFYALLKNKNVMITTSFSDVSNDAWYATAVKTMASLGMMSGYPDGTFRPDEPITRAEFATVALAFAYEPDNARCSYLDVSTSAWYYTYVAQATTYGWIGGYPDGTFRPNNSITRVEVCVIVNNMLGRTPDEDYIDRNEDELVNFVDLSDRYWGYYTIMEATNGHEYTGNYSNETWKDVV